MERLISQKLSVKKINAEIEFKIKHATNYLQQHNKIKLLFDEKNLFAGLNDLKEEYSLLEILDFDITKKDILLNECSILDMAKYIACLKLNRLSKIEKIQKVK